MTRAALAIYVTLCFILSLSSSLSVMSVIKDNMSRWRWWGYNIQCFGDSEYQKDMSDIGFWNTAYLVSFGPNTTGNYALDVECSGALLTEWYIFTAAHCFYKPDGGKKDLNTLWAVSGASHIYGYNWWREYRGFAEAWIHSDYKPMTFINDFAIGEIKGGFNIKSAWSSVDIIYAYSPWSLDQNVLDIYWKMCTAVGFWTAGGTWNLDVECVRQLGNSGCNYSAGIKGAMCVGHRRTPFKEQGSPLVCFDYHYGSVLTAILLSSVFDEHNNVHYPALYIRVKDYWYDTTVRLSEARD